VPHGCDGSATVALRARIPQGYIDVKPMPKPGWKLEVKPGTYASPSACAMPR
jgi:periplasmic copper chaperone A